MEKRKNGGIIIFLIVCIFVSLAAGLFGGYKYYELKNNDDNKEDRCEDNKVVDSNEKEDNTQQEEIIKDGDVTIINNVGKDIIVKDYINYTIDRTGIKICGGRSEYGKANVRIPMIDSEKQGVTEINDLIKKELSLYLDSSYYKLGSKGGLELISSYGYWYVNNFEYLTLKVSSINASYCATGSSYNYYYTYDIENDNYLTNDELLKLYKISYEDLKKKIKDVLDIQVDHYDSIVYYLDRGKYELYITENGDLGIEVTYGPASRFQYNHLVSLKNVGF